MSYLDFWWAVIMEALRPVFIGLGVLVVIIVLAVAFLS